MSLPSEFFTLHKDLPREGPGDTESLEWTLSHIDLPRDGAILDAGCGPGADIADLLRFVPAGRVSGIDAHAPFIDAARDRHADNPQVSLVQGDMASPPDGPYDLIWCAGALYFLGIKAGLSAWKPHLKSGAHVIFSEPLYFVDQPSDNAVEFWEGYPTGHLADVNGAITAAGYQLTAHRKLPDAAWEAYYKPMEQRIAKLRPEASDALHAVLDKAETEIAGWRDYKDETGYGQFIVTPNKTSD